MKLLDQYISAKNALQEKAANAKLSVQQVVELQELNYRIDVFDSVRMMCKTAPISKDGKLLSHHYALVSAYVGYLPKERQLGNKADEELKNKRETANEALVRVIEDGSKRFKSFNAEADDTYKKQLGEYVCNVLTIWVQYRNTYVSIKVGA